MYEMLTGLPPFYSQDVQVMYQKIMTAKLVIPETISSDAASLLRGLLERDPSKRLQDPEVIKAHPYFKSIDWKAMTRKEVRRQQMFDGVGVFTVFFVSRLSRRMCRMRADRSSRLSALTLRYQNSSLGRTMPSPF